MVDLKFETPDPGHVLIIPHLPMPLVFVCQSLILFVFDLLLALSLAIQRLSDSDPWPCSDLGSWICPISNTYLALDP